MADFQCMLLIERMFEINKIITCFLLHHFCYINLEDRSSNRSSPVKNVVRKATVLESLFNKVAGLQVFSFIHVNIAKHFRTTASGKSNGKTTFHVKYGSRKG